MFEKDLLFCPHFSKNEILNTGARIDEIDAELMQRMENLRVMLNRRIYLMFITTGRHATYSYHYTGKAVDFYLNPEDGVIDPSRLIEAALSCGFKGIGVYYNGTAYSFHVDIRFPYTNIWCAIPSTNPKEKWTYMPINKDPKEIYDNREA